MSQGASGGMGYEASQSTSESNTLGLNTTKGPFSVGGGIRIPEWFWPVAIVVAGLVAWKWLSRK